jgi:glucokinase
MSASTIGVDLGVGRVIAAPLHDRALGEALIRPTDRSDTDALVDQLVTLVQEVRTRDTQAVGIAVPRIVEYASGRIVAPRRRAAPVTNGAVDLPLANVPLRDVLEARIDMPVFVENDASAAALAEAHDDTLELVARYLVLFAIGTTVGGGLVLDGRIYRGATGAAGELGHMIVGLDLAGAVPAPMRFPQPGSIEFVTAGHALDRLAEQAGAVRPGSALAHLRAAGKPVLGADVIHAAKDGDKAAGRMVEIWGQRMGVGVANAINTFDPEEVVIGGDAAGAGRLVLEPARHVAHGYVRPGLGARTTIRLARHGATAGVLGAALLARAELDGDDAS